MSAHDIQVLVIYLSAISSSIFTFFILLNLIEDGKGSLIGKLISFIPSQLRKRHYFTKRDIREANTLFRCVSLNVGIPLRISLLVLIEYRLNSINPGWMK